VSISEHETQKLETQKLKPQAHAHSYTLVRVESSHTIGTVEIFLSMKNLAWSDKGPWTSDSTWTDQD